MVFVISSELFAVSCKPSDFDVLLLTMESLSRVPIKMYIFCFLRETENILLKDFISIYKHNIN